MENCVFCKIANGEIKVEKIWENDYFLAFPDAHPVGEGHTLIIPKEHFETILDLNDAISQKYISAIKEVGKILLKKYKADGFNIVLNNGKTAGQVVKHIHFHLLPRKEGDNLRGIFIG